MTTQAEKDDLLARITKAQSVGATILSNMTAAKKIASALGVDDAPAPSPDPVPDPVPTPDPEPAPVSVVGWPNATTTGVAGAGLNPDTLPKVSNPAVTGQLVEGKYFTNGIDPKTAGAVIRKCVIIGGYWGVEPNVDNLRFEDCTFIGGDNCAIMDDLYRKNITYLRCDISGSTDGMKLSGDTRLIQDCFIHDLKVTKDSHNDGIQCYSGSNWIFRHNWVQGVDTSCIAMFQGQGQWSNVTIDGNYFDGKPAYPVYAGGSSATGVSITGNVFSGWAFGAVSDWGAVKGVKTWSGNTDSTGKTVNP